MDIAKLDMEFTENDILTYAELNQIEEKIGLITSTIRELNATKEEILYNNENINYNNEVINYIEEE